MGQYYERALAVKQEILQRPDLIEKIKEAYAAYPMNPELISDRWIGVHGTYRDTLRVGRLQSGLWIAHKVWPDMDMPIKRKKIWGKLEAECQEFEAMYEGKKHPVPSFHLVVVCNGIGSLLTEDVTQGGKHESRDLVGRDIMFVDDGKNFSFIVDLDYVRSFDRRRYTVKKAMLEV